MYWKQLRILLLFISCWNLCVPFKYDNFLSDKSTFLKKRKRDVGNSVTAAVIGLPRSLLHGMAQLVALL